MLVNLHHPPSPDPEDLQDELTNLLSLAFPALRTRRRPPAPPLSLFASGPGGDRQSDKKQGKFTRAGKASNGEAFHGDECGPINIEAVQQIMAAKWAIDVINNQSKPSDLKIGKNVNNQIIS